MDVFISDLRAAERVIESAFGEPAATTEGAVADVYEAFDPHARKNRYE
jgi:hypothetical protein